MSPVGAIMRGQAKAKAAKRAVDPEAFNRFERKDFWNDPERWDGIEDPWATKIWEVRRRDVIDVRPKPKPDYDPYMNANRHWQQPASPLQGLQQGGLLNQYAAGQPSLFGSFGNLFRRY